MELEELLPIQPTFTARGKTYTIRKIGVKDISWAAQIFGSQEAAMEMLGSKDLSGVSQFVYHQLSESEKDDFPAVDVERRDDSGEKVKTRLTGPQALLEALTDDETEAMCKSLIRAMVLGSPKLEPGVLKALQEEKKRAAKMAEIWNDQIGLESTTPSQPSTDSLPKSSEP